LNDSGALATGTYDFRFRLALDPLGNNYVGTNFFANGVPVSGGLFTVAMDFGAAVFNGTNLWLEVDVRTNNAIGYTVLNPLQPLTSSPYAIQAASAANLTGTLPASQLTGAIGSAQLAGSYSGPVAFPNPNNCHLQPIPNHHCRRELQFHHVYHRSYANRLKRCHPATFSSSGKLVVSLANISGTRVQSDFSFAVYKSGP
jgi:hypothetical protein